MTGLRGGIDYTFRVVALNGFGDGTAATTSTVTPAGTGTTYVASVLEDAPSLYWRIGETTPALAADSSGNDRRAIFFGTFTQGVAGALSTDANTALQATTGERLRYRAAAGLPLGNAARSMEMWFKTSVANETHHLAGYGTSSGSTRQFFGLRLEGTVRLELEAGGSEELSFIAPRQLNDGGWHHVVASYNGSALTMYLDGLSLGAQNFTAALNTTINTEGLQLGHFEGTTTSDFSGTADELALYPSALSSSDVSAHFAASANTRPAAPGSVSAAAGANQATVSWSASTATVPSGQPAVVGYVVTALEAGTTPRQTVVVGPSATSAVLTGLRGGVEYTFRTAAFNSFGDGAAATTASAGPTGSASTYASTVLEDTPSLYYRLGENGPGVAADSAGSDRRAIYTGVTQGITGAVAGDTSAAVSLSGGDSVRYRALAGLPSGNAARSIEVWVKISVANSTQHLLSYGSSAARTFFGVRLIGTNTLEIFAGGSEEAVWPAGAPLNDGVWHHVVATYDGTIATMYLDGASLGTRTFTAALNTTPTTFGLQLGRFEFTTTGHFSGSADELAVYPSALSAREVLEHWRMATQLPAGRSKGALS